jgi:hypothetical protein
MPVGSLQDGGQEGSKLCRSGEDVAEASSIDPGRHRDLEGRGTEPWLRRGLVVVLVVVAVAALTNQVGQHVHSSTTTAPAATLEVSTPKRLRAGLLYQTRFTIVARHRIKRPRLVLGSGWFDGLTLNTTEPQASEEKNRDGTISFEYDELEPGQRLKVWLEYQVNPTTTGTRKQRVALDDGGKTLASQTRTTTVLP